MAGEQNASLSKREYSYFSAPSMPTARVIVKADLRASSTQERL